MKKDNLIFIHKLLKAIADSIIKVFIPLYILKITGDVSLSMIYLVSYSALTFALMFLFKKIIEKHGVLCILLHFIFIIASNATLSFAPISLWHVLLTALLMAFSQTFYSIPLNLIFTFGDKKSNVAKFQIPTNIGKLLFTLASGLFLSSDIPHSFLILSGVSTLFYLAAAFPLFFIYKELNAAYVVYHEEKKEKIKLDPLFILFHLSFGLFQPIMDNVLPLFLFVNQLSFTAVTFMIVLVELFKIAINILSQFLVKKGQQILCVSIGFVLAVTSLIIMLTVKNAVVLYIFSTAYSITFPLTFVPMFRMYCQYLRKADNIFEGMTRRDLEIFSCRPFLYATAFAGLGLMPILIFGTAILPFMLFFEMKLIRKYPNHILEQEK